MKVCWFSTFPMGYTNKSAVSVLAERLPDQPNRTVAQNLALLDRFRLMEVGYPGTRRRNAKLADGMPAKLQQCELNLVRDILCHKFPLEYP